VIPVARVPVPTLAITPDNVKDLNAKLKF